MSDTQFDPISSEIPSNDETPVIASIEEENKRLIAENKRLSEIATRAQADYVNLTRRSESEKADFSFFLTKKVLLAFLPTIDNLDRALSNIPVEVVNHPWTIGLQSMRSSLQKELEKISASSFDSVGMLVDPDVHEVMLEAPGEQGMVISEFERGWKLGDKVVRHAKVVGGNGENVNK